MKRIFVLRTAPTTLESKKGSGGKAVNLRTNYFSLNKKPNWSLYQYRVDMSPDIDYTKVSVRINLLVLLIPYRELRKRIRASKPEAYFKNPLNLKKVFVSFSFRIFDPS